MRNVTDLGCIQFTYNGAWISLCGEGFGKKEVKFLEHENFLIRLLFKEEEQIRLTFPILKGLINSNRPDTVKKIISKMLERTITIRVFGLSFPGSKTQGCFGPERLVFSANRDLKLKLSTLISITYENNRVVIKRKNNLILREYMDKRRSAIFYGVIKECFSIGYKNTIK